jgi:predicted kinase
LIAPCGDSLACDDLRVAELQVGRPILVIVSGPAGSGKTTLAHRLAATIGCPALCRDEIKEGMAAASRGFVPGPLDPLTLRTYDLFFAVIRLFLENGVTHVAEAAFQHPNWARGLEPLRPLAELRILRCQVPDALSQSRAESRRHEQPARAAHDDAGHFSVARSFDPIRLSAPTLDVDTTSGYNPDLEAIAAFVRLDSGAVTGPTT